MRADTQVWFRFESHGTPEHTVIQAGSVRELFKAFMIFMLATRLNKRITVTITREKIDLFPQQTRRSKSDQLMEVLSDEFDRLEQQASS
jgi:hypothetical protein